MASTTLDDVRHSVRRLIARPGYALLAVVTLAAGVGGTAATSAIARGVLLDRLPFAHADEVGVFWKKTDWTEEEFLFVRGRVPGFRQVALYRHRDVLRREGGAPARLLPGVAASAELFDVLGAAPLIGRTFRAGDDVPGAEPVAVLSFGLWQESGADPAIVGRRITLDGMPRTVVGVMPRGFWFPDPTVRVWTPAALRPDGRSWSATLIGRVAPGYRVSAMEAPVGQLVAMLDARFDYPAQWDKTRDARITPLRDDVVGGIRPALLATAAAMGLILLIACANVAALMLGQVEARSVELAVRSALGASRHRLLRPLVVEALLIASAAATLGAALAWRGFSLVTRALPLGAWAETVAPDWRVFATAAAIGVGAGLLVLVVPAVAVHRGDLRGVLGRARTAGVEGRGGRLENGLVVAEVALAVLVATGAALLARSVGNLYALPPGVRTEGVAVVDLAFAPDLPTARLQGTLDVLRTSVATLPGVRSVGTAQTLPLRGGRYNAPLVVPDRPELVGLSTEFRIVSPGYVESIGMTVRRGRAIEARDRRDTEPVVVVNETLARQHFPGVDPIGRLLGEGERPRRIVGVIADALERGLADAAVPVRYVPLAQQPWIDTYQSLVLRAAPGSDETALLDAARRRIAEVAPGVAVQQTTTMRRVLDTAVGPARQVVDLLALLTALALGLGAVGVYGAVAHVTTRRRRDWAIRVALGLTGRRVMAQVLGHAAGLVVCGIALGALAAAALTRLLSSLLFGVSALDPMAFATAGAVLLGTGLAAAFLPAWRAGTADPIRALRDS